MRRREAGNIIKRKRRRMVVDVDVDVEQWLCGMSMVGFGAANWIGNARDLLPSIDRKGKG